MLLDYLVHLNAKDPDLKNLEKGGWMKMAFDEGFGGVAGADKEYWKLRIKEEHAKHRSNKGIKPGLSYQHDADYCFWRPYTPKCMASLKRQCGVPW